MPSSSEMDVLSQPIGFQPDTQGTLYCQQKTHKVLIHLQCKAVSVSFRWFQRMTGWNLFSKARECREGQMSDPLKGWFNLMVTDAKEPIVGWSRLMMSKYLTCPDTNSLILERGVYRCDILLVFYLPVKPVFAVLFDVNKYSLTTIRNADSVAQMLTIPPQIHGICCSSVQHELILCAILCILLLSDIQEMTKLADFYPVSFVVFLTWPTAGLMFSQKNKTKTTN